MLADALRPPFAEGAFDTVVTPWLIDIVSENLTVFAARINRLLKEGGRWVNFGSLAFAEPACRARAFCEQNLMPLVRENLGEQFAYSHFVVNNQYLRHTCPVS